MGWLVGAAARKAVGGAMMAAALLFTACSSDDTMGWETKTEQTATVIRVTVGAGITDPTPDPSPTREGSSATTRSTVDVTTDGETGKKTRTLKFTGPVGDPGDEDYSAGDKLYVWRELAGDVTKYLAGVLTMKDGSPTDGGTQASFEGELTVYDGTGAPASYDFQGGNPLAGATATLLHAGMKETDAEGGDYSIDGATKALTFADATGVAATVEELMTKGLVVSGLYDAENDRFPLSATQPILNCTISGLEAGVSYKVDYIYGATAEMDGGTKTLAASMEATDGTLSFAFIAETGDKFHGIRLTNTAEPTDTYDATIGRKEFASKVYNATRTAIGKKTPLTIEAITDGDIVVWSPKSGMRYKINDGEMTTWTGNLTFAKKTIYVAAGDKVQFYGNGTNITSYSGTTIYLGTAQVKVYGNIMSLVDETSFATATTLTAEKAFYQLFYNYSALKDASGLLLPATTLSSNCYERMFVTCDNLTAAPALPATTLAEGCYDSMFIGCTSLTAAPALPATTLASNCYNSMFGDCTSLTAAPALPATTLASNCYNAMFTGCTSLATAPALPAVTLAERCYDKMFGQCTSLTTAPALPATTLADRCYKQMFEGCTSLTTVPATLPATTLASYCCYQMFQDCTSLTTVPEQLLPATTLAKGCYERMFWNCTNLTAVPALPATTLSEGCYNKMFGQCTSLTTAPALPATTLADNCYDSMFNGCTNLSSVTCLATDISALDCTDNWLSGVAATGTFTKASTMTSWPSNSADGIPEGWTVVDAQ